MNNLYNELKAKRNRITAPYIVFVLMFIFSFFIAVSGIEFSTFLTLAITLLVATLPIILLNISLHKAIHAIKPTSASSGLKQTIIYALFLTPFEVALVLPAINLYIATKLIRNFESNQNNTIKPFAKLPGM